MTHAILLRAGVQSDKATRTSLPLLHEWLAAHEDSILRPSEDRIKSGTRECSKTAVRRRFRSFLRFASALPVRVPHDEGVRSSLLASFTTEMVDCALHNTDDILSSGE